FLINNETALLRDKEGKTCLHVAAEQGAIQSSKLILEMSGVDMINERDNKKQTPLHLSTLNGHARGIKILMDNGADPNIKDVTGASPIDYVTKRNLFFCNSIIEICLRNYDKKNRLQGASSQNSVASSFNGSESNLTPAPPTTPKNNFYRSFQVGLGRPPRPINTNSMSNEFNKTAPASLNNINSTEPDELRNTIAIPPSPPTGVKTRPNLRNGWNSTERIQSGSIRLSRASTRTSLASDDLEKYMNGSLTNLNNPPSQVPVLKPIAPPRISSSGSGNMRMYSSRPHESSASLDAPATQAPPPIKPRKSSSITSLNNADNRLAQINGKSSLVSLNSNNLNVEDMSDEEYSITSVKGEGFASDLSDTEIKNQVNPRMKTKKIAFEHNPKRPSTPMDIRLSEQAKNERDPVKNIKHHHMSDPAVTMTRFNEWDPFRQKENLERQKSPLKSKHQSNFAQTFLNVTDSSPRQFSGRVQVGSASQKAQQTTQFVNGSSTNQETNSSANLDLVISGQKLGSRKDSPTSTPREVSAHPDKKRIYSRRLQPLDKNSEMNSSNEGQFVRQKTSKSHTDRKKLEPIRGPHHHNGLNTSHLENLTHSITETDPTSQTIGNNDDEPSLSENTISSDKQIIYNVRVNKKKAAFGKARKNLIGPIIGSDEALKM
ncbi:ankyrin repeat domain-containing 55-like, partial [Brachionus plicatilis]